jgi:hypothetical protein
LEIVTFEGGPTGFGVAVGAGAAGAGAAAGLWAKSEAAGSRRRAAASLIFMEMGD